MNMISTGTFLPEMDASTKQATLAEKFAGVWEKKKCKSSSSRWRFFDGPVASSVWIR
jgi:hypothetical protein